jgi:glycosyltransferase involved in cell wall biosynthesis
VCLVTPGHLSTNPRLVKEADALAGAGYEVSIVASRFIGWADEADRELDGRDWAVTKVGFGPYAGKVGRVRQGIRRRLFEQLFRLIGPLPWVAEGAFHPVIPGLTRAACAVKADLYIAHNLAALPAAGRAAEVHGARLGFDAEDFHSGELPDGPGSRRARSVVRAIEARYLPRCDHLTAASPGIARAYSTAYGIREPVVVLNVFPRRDAPPAPVVSGAIDSRGSLYWFSQTIGPDRGLETAIEAIGRSVSRPLLVLRGNPAAGYRERLMALASRCGAGDGIRFETLAAPGKLVKMAAPHDLGLASEVPVTENRSICLTNKIFTYLLAGVPVLASATTAQARIARQMPGALFLYPPGDAEALSRLIDDLLLSPTALAQARRAAWELGQGRYNWEAEQAVFLASVVAVLKEKGGGVA